LTKPSIVILGAGPAGLTSAYFHLQKGHQVTVIEKSSETGGLSRGVSFLGGKFDLGPHSFYANYSQESIDFLKRFIGEDNFFKKKSSKLVQAADGALFYVPWRIWDTLKLKNTMFFAGYVLYKLIALPSLKNGKSALEKHGLWVKRKIFSPYCIKYFNLSSEQVSNDFVALLYANQEKEEDNSIYLTKSGYIGRLWENVFEYLCQSGVRFELNQEVVKIHVAGERAVKVQTANGTHQADHIISTIPLQSIHRLLFPNENNFASLNYRATVMVFVEIEDLKTDALYLTNYNVDNPIGRVSFCSNWKQHVDRHVISVEFWCDETDSIFKKPDASILEDVITYLKTLSIVRVEKNMKFKIIRIPKCYPVLDKEYTEKVSFIKSHLSRITNLTMAGRHGKFEWDGLNDIINAIHNE